MSVIENEFAFFELRDESGELIAVSTHREPLEVKRLQLEAERELVKHVHV